MKTNAQLPVSQHDALPDLFGAKPRPRPSRRAVPSRPPELVRARALCRELQQTRAPEDKRRVAHLICLNLKAMLQQPTAR
jgi:hypothetical protein